MIILAKLEYFNNFNDTFYMCNKLNIDAFAVKYFINNRILQDKNYQITLKYGTKRTFNLWKYEEKFDYLKKTRDVIDILYKISPYIFYAYGTLLGFIRENDGFIPYDYDIDIIMIVESDKFLDLSEFENFFIPFLRKNNIEIVKHGLSYYHIKYNNSPRFDIFPGIKDKVGNVYYHGIVCPDIKYIYPTIDIDIMGIKCPIPRNPFYFFDTWYGKDWRIPKEL